MSAQTPGGVVIRERVAVTRPAAVPADTARGAARGTADPCAGGAVAYAVFAGDVYNPSGTGTSLPRTIGAPLSGTLDVSGACGSASGSLTDGFEFAFDIPSYAYFFYSPVGEILRLPLSPTAPLPDSFAVTIAGETRTQGQTLHFGCSQAYGATCDRTPPDFVAAEIGIRSYVEGGATGHAHAWPDTVACGTTTPLPITLTKPDGTEGWVGPGVSQTFQQPGANPAVSGVLAYDGATGGVFYGVPYGDSRAGAVAYVAPACEALSGPTGATLWVTGLPGGTLLSDNITVVLPPPDRLVVTADPDTLEAGGRAWVTSVAFADEHETYLDPETPVTLSASPAGAGYLAFSRPYEPSVSGESITIPYNHWYSSYAAGARPGVYFIQTGPTPEADLAVTITASGGGLSGAGQVVVLGRLRLELDADPDSIATGGESALTATLQGAGAAAFDPEATLTFALDSPSTGTLRRTSTDSTGTMLTGIPRAEAAAGGVTFVAVARQAPPVLARGAVMARGDSTAVDSVWASARVTATVDGRTDLTDTARIAVGGTSGLTVELVCTGFGAARACIVRVDLPAGLCDTVATVQVAIRGGRGTLVIASTGERITVGEGGATVTVTTAEALAGGVRFEPDATGTIRIGTVTVGFGEPAFTCDSEPILPGETTVASGPLPACPPRQARGVGAQVCIPEDDGGSPVVSLLDQGGHLVERGYVMVSRVRPDWLLDFPPLPFEPAPRTVLFPETGPPLSTQYDPHTYRPEASGIRLDTDSSSVLFRMTVLRGGSAVEIWDEGVESGAHDLLTTYPAVCEAQGVDRQDCRATRYVRLVSNARPANLSGLQRNCGDPLNGTCYDDEHLGTQTVRVELGDVVRWELLVAGTALDTRDYTVGALGTGVAGTPAPDPYDVARTVRVRLVGTQNLEYAMDPDGTARQMSQMWAQAGLNFQSVNPQVNSPDLVGPHAPIEIDVAADDALGRPALFPADGMIRARINEGAWVSLAVDGGEPVHEAVVQLVGRLGPGSGVRVHGYRTRETPTSRPNFSTFIYVDGTSVTLGFSSDVQDLRIRNREVVSGGMAVAEVAGLPGSQGAYQVFMLEAHALALAWRDADPATINTYVLPNYAFIQASPGSLRGFSHSLLPSSSEALSNSVFLRASAADGSDQHAADFGEQPNGYPHTAGHEIGHVLFDGSFPLADATGHIVGVYDNVMTSGSGLVPNQLALGSRRRLTRDQQVYARTSQPSLLSPFVPDALAAPNAHEESLTTRFPVAPATILVSP